MLTKAELAAARADVPALLAHIEELEAKLQHALDYARAAADFSVPFRTHGRGRWTDMIELLQEEDEK